MTRKSVLLMITAATLLAGGIANAQDAAPPGLTPEERQAKRAEMRERWESMSEEERAALREERRAQREARRAENRERWEEHVG